MDLLITVADELTTGIDGLRFTRPITHVYNPLQYARTCYANYVERYGTGTKEVVLVGMNPGPWGMAQTGIPFGEVNAVREWLGIEFPIEQPARPHPKRPILGFDCTRSEVSGQRVWGWARDTFCTPERFFRRFFIANYCPLIFFDADGKNRTPDKIRRRERLPLLAVCDRALQRTVSILRPAFVIGLGRFAEARALEALSDMNVRVSAIPHPSPANPQANRGWNQLASETLVQLGIDL
jgi:single-strand selective monofunctional uracil DNA glycosylase